MATLEMGGGGRDREVSCKQSALVRVFCPGSERTSEHVHVQAQSKRMLPDQKSGQRRLANAGRTVEQEGPTGIYERQPDTAAYPCSNLACGIGLILPEVKPAAVLSSTCRRPARPTASPTRARRRRVHEVAAGGRGVPTREGPRWGAAGASCVRVRLCGSGAAGQAAG